MPRFQKYNKKIDAFVMFDKAPNNKTLILDVKQKNPSKPFKGIKIK